MKNVLRDWLGIDEEKFALEVQLNTLQRKLQDLDDKLESLESEVSDTRYEVEDKVSEYDVGDIVRDIAYHDIYDIKNDLDEDYSEIIDHVFDLVMKKIENRDKL